MSLVTGLLNWTCDVYSFTQVDDGQGGFTFGPNTLKSAGIDFLKAAKFVNKSTPNGGTVFVEQTLGYFEYADNTVVKEGDIITNLVGPNGQKEIEIVNGISSPTFYKLKSLTDPNLENDHLEADLEKVRGRLAVQP